MRYIHPSEERVLEAIARLGGHKTGHNENFGTPLASFGDSQVIELDRKNMVSADGLEPSTHSLKGCSAFDYRVGRKDKEERRSPMFMRGCEACALLHVRECYSCQSEPMPP
jgi:hypothetical protein